jgi:hypothetical protein
MMKKLLALALVLGMAGIASAGLVATVGETAPGMATIALSLESGNISAYKLGLEWDTAAVVADFSGVAFPAVFDFAGKSQAVSGNYAEITAGQFLSPAVAAPAVLMEGLMVDFLALAPGEVATLNFVSKGGTKIDGVAVPAGEIVATAEVVGIPEPMTIGLLGVGALFLRRRK